MSSAVQMQLVIIKEKEQDDEEGVSNENMQDIFM